MAKRPKLSNHLRLADAPPRPDERPDSPSEPQPQRAKADAEPERAAAPTPPAGGHELLDILTDATAEMTRLTYLGWSKAWDVQLRLARFWFGRDRLP